MEQQQALDVIKRGMSTEVWGLRFYEQAAKRTVAADGKKVFESLIAEESRHLEILRGEYAALPGGKKLSTAEAMSLAAAARPTDIFPAAQSADELIPASASDEQALQMAMDFEMKGFKTYEAQAQAATSAEEKRLWGYLAKAEDGHYTFLQKTLEYLQTNGAWYFDDTELPMFET